MTPRVAKEKVDVAPVHRVVDARGVEFDLAFEHGVNDGQSELWRVLSIRNFNDRELRHANWFVTEEEARQHATWIADGRGRVLSVKKYRAC